MIWVGRCNRAFPFSLFSTHLPTHPPPPPPRSSTTRTSRPSGFAPLPSSTPTKSRSAPLPVRNQPPLPSHLPIFPPPYLPTSPLPPPPPQLIRTASFSSTFLYIYFPNSLSFHPPTHLPPYRQARLLREAHCHRPQGHHRGHRGGREGGHQGEWVGGWVIALLSMC